MCFHTFDRDKYIAALTTAVNVVGHHWPLSWPLHNEDLAQPFESRPGHGTWPWYFNLGLRMGPSTTQSDKLVV